MFSYFIKAGAAAVAVAGLTFLTACGPKHAAPDGAAAAQARASASAFATSPAVQHDEVTELRHLSACTATSTSGQLAFTVTTTTQGQAAVPGTTTPAYPHITMTHWSLRLLHHLGDKIDATINCAAPKGTRASVKGCVEHLSLPTSKAGISGYLIGVANCMVGAPQ